MYLALFVDDGLIVSESNDAIQTVVIKLSNAFKITVADAKLFIGMQIERDRSNKRIFIHQSLYTCRILEKFNFIKAKSVNVPADPHTTLTNSDFDEREITNVPYREAVGSLMFLALVTRPDIAYAVNIVSRYLDKFKQSHWNAIKRIFRYLIDTAEYGLLYEVQDGKDMLIGYSDADFAGDIDTRRSTTGFVFNMCNAPVSWSSQRQKLVTLSTTESEYVAASTASKEAVWLRQLLKDLDCDISTPTDLYVDNQSTIRLINNPEFHKRTKHVDIRFHFVREKIQNKDIAIKYVPSEKQLADICTKALPRDRFHTLRFYLNICDMKHVHRGSVKHCLQMLHVMSERVRKAEENMRSRSSQ